jgi:hypothetical protein
MTGHVFHPGHDEWHGQTVVVFAGLRTVVGRWDAVQAGRLLLHDCAVHEAGAAGAEPRDDFLARLKQYGVPAQHRDYMLPHAEVERVTRLRDA